MSSGILQPAQGGTGFSSLNDLAAPGNPVGDAIALGGANALLTLPNGVLLDAYKLNSETTYDNALAKAATALGTKGGIVYLGTAANYVFTSMVVPKSVSIVGRYKTPPFPGTNQSVDFTNLQWIRIKTGGTITLNAGAYIGQVAIAPEGMAFPQNSSSAWAGTCFTIAGDATGIENVLCVGFDTCYTAVARARGVIHNLFFDCNNGISIQNAWDTTRINGVHGWPFATIQAYAATLQVVNGVDTYDSTIAYRTGTGMKFRNSNDDTQIDGCIMVGFKIGYDFADTAGIRCGRLWSECYSLPGTIGFKFSSAVDNVFINDAQIWGCEKPILMDVQNGNRVAFDRIIVLNATAAPLVIQGGNISFNSMTCRGLPASISCITYVNTGDGRATYSYVSGLLIDESNGNATTPPVIACAGLETAYLDNLKVVSPYRAPGVSMVGGNIIYPKYLTAAGNLFLPINGDMFKVQGSDAISAVGGFYGGRRVLLLFTSTVVVNMTAAAGGGIASNTPGVTSRTFKAGGILDMYFDATYGSWREITAVTQ
jgi:hypothetical protein